MPLNLNTPVQSLARPDPVRLNATDTIDEALARLRGQPLGERILYFYVTDEEGKLLGVVPTRRLLLTGPSAKVADAMVQPVFAVAAGEPLGNALKILKDRRLLALPVVDPEGRLSGVLDVSTVTQTLFDLERSAAADEIFQIVGLHLEQDHRDTFAWLLRNRFPWLLLNIASGILAALISRNFEHAFRAVVAVAFFIPLVLTLAESVAMQTVTISLQQLLTPADRSAMPVLREFKAGLLLALLSGTLVAAIGYAWLGAAVLSPVVAIAIVAAGGIGATFGYLVPRLLRQFQLDPKIAAGPAVLALTDVAALFAYLGLAALVLS